MRERRGVIRRLAVAYFGGALGGLASTLAVWLVARAGLLDAIDVRLAPSLTWPALAPRLLWGSLWGLGHPLVSPLRGPVQAGLLLSLAPSAAQLLYFFPARGGEIFGVNHGALAPLVVLLANALWGWVLGRTVATATGGR
jgi:hypothetical protein